MSKISEEQMSNTLTAHSGTYQSRFNPTSTKLQMAEDATRMDLSFGDSDDDDDDYEIEAKSSHHQKIDESFSTAKI